MPQWSLEHGLNKSIAIDNFTYPYRSFRLGEEMNLVAILRLYEENIDYVCRAPFQGYKILLHPPNEEPNFQRHFLNIRVPLEKYVMVAVTPNMITTSEGLRSYPPSRRQCYYKWEKPLQFFKIYTQSNCEIECLTNATYATCGCVRFAMPRKLCLNLGIISFYFPF